MVVTNLVFLFKCYKGGLVGCIMFLESLDICNQLILLLYNSLVMHSMEVSFLAQSYKCLSSISERKKINIKGSDICVVTIHLTMKWLPISLCLQIRLQ